MKRACKWMSLSKHDHRIKPMIGQVGGLGVNRKPILTLIPDYLLKPLVLDHRGLREIAFYEAIRTVVSQSQPQQEILYNYNNFLSGRRQQQEKEQQSPEATNNYVSSLNALLTSIRITTMSVLTPIMQTIDTISMAFALTYIQDPYVLQSEKILHEAWQNIQYEIDITRQLHKFTPPYYGVIAIETPSVDTTLATTLTSTEVPTTATTCASTLLTMATTTIPTTISDSANSTVNTATAVTDLNNFWNQLEDSHLLLQDLTINYSKPCVMDLKMGVQTYVRTAVNFQYSLCSYIDS